MAKTLSAKSRKPAKAKRAAPKKVPVKAKPPAMASAGDNAPLGTLDETQRANVMKLGADGKNGGKPATNKGAKHPPPEPVPGAVDNFERQAGDTVN